MSKSKPGRTEWDTEIELHPCMLLRPGITSRSRRCYFIDQASSAMLSVSNTSGVVPCQKPLTHELRQATEDFSSVIMLLKFKKQASTKTGLMYLLTGD